MRSIFTGRLAAPCRKRFGIGVCLRQILATLCLNILAYGSLAFIGVMAQAELPALDLRDYQLTFDEEFRQFDVSANGPGTRWIAHTPWHGDFGDAIFTDPGPNGPFKTGPHGLEITARKETSGKWRSGLICSVDRDGPGQKGFSQQYGYFEMKARLPGGPGVWPAFWLIGTDKTKGAAEIDVIEYFGAFPKYYHNWLHFFRGGKDELSQEHLVTVPYGSLTSQFNTYGVLVEADETTFYLNRKPVWRVKTPPEHRQPMYILVDLALGGGWPIDKLTSPQTMEVEYVKAFQHRGKTNVVYRP